MSQYQKGKTNLDFTEARDSVAVASAVYVQVCTSLQTDNHASTPQIKYFTGRMHFLPPNQQRQSTENKLQLPRAMMIHLQNTSEHKEHNTEHCG